MISWQRPITRIGDIVLYSPDCAGDRCDHPASDEHPAIIVHVDDDGVAALSVFHPVSVAHLIGVPYDPAGGPRSWRERPGEYDLTKETT